MQRRLDLVVPLCDPLEQKSLLLPTLQELQIPLVQLITEAQHFVEVVR